MVTKKTPQSLSFKRQFAYSVIIVCTLLSLGELAIRVWAYYFRTSYERYNFATGRLELVPNIQYITPEGHEFLINSKGFLGPEFADHPASGVSRIIAVGDSCTFSGGFWKLAYPAILEGLLNSQHTQQSFEVINAGIEGFNSTFALNRIEQEIIRYRPHVVTIYIGWNDLMKTDPDKLSATGEHTLLTLFMERSFLAKVYNKLLFSYLRPLIFQPKITTDDNGARAYDNFVPSRYQENLTQIVKLLKSHEIKTIIFTLPTVVRPHMTREEISKQNIIFPYFAGTYSIDKFLSLHRSYNNVIRGIAKLYNISIVDLDSIFSQYNLNGLFWDTLHPSTNGHIIIAEHLKYTITKIYQEQIHGKN